MKASLIWLALGVTLGMGIAVRAEWIIYRPAHVHMNVLGFVTMMIYGFAYHVVPRFTGHQLFSRRLAGWHWWIANAGLAGMVLGFVAKVQPGASAAVLSKALLGVGGSLAAMGAYAFIYNVWRTMDGPSQRRNALPLSRADGERVVGGG